MRDRSRVVPATDKPRVGDIVGGDVYGSKRHADGTTITTGDVVEVRAQPYSVVTRHHDSTEVYELGKWMWGGVEGRENAERFERSLRGES